ncbi:MAG: hypothetical protein K9W44_01110 [Candidatus Lokiarchaeota archaeon]|nr:hypothetical protein [Candidatus Harpocratesius repetitus]
MSTSQVRTLARLNRLITLQQQLQFYEKSTDYYKQGLNAFKAYVECVREFNKPRDLVNSYIRMAKYCEKMEDLLLSRDLYHEAMNLMITFQIGTKVNIRNLRQKIQALRHFY